MGMEKENPLPPVRYIQEFEEQKRAEDLNLITTVDKEVQGVLAEIQYIAELLETNKNIAPVENLTAKIKAAVERIKKLMDPRQQLEQEASLEEGNRRTAGGVVLEQNPLIKENGGLPLENFSAEWGDLKNETLDKAELENLVNKKLKNRVELANKLKAQNKLTPQAKPRVTPQITPKFQKIQQTLKYIVKEIPKPEAPAPRPEAPRPRPMGMGS